MNQRPKIGIFNAYWLVHSSLGYMASCLEKAGYAVDVYLYCSDESLTGDLLRKTAFVRVHRFGSNSTKATSPNAKRLDTDNKSAGRDVRTAADGAIWPYTSNTARKATFTDWIRQLAKTVLPKGGREWLRELQESVLLKWLPGLGIVPGDLVQKAVDACKEDRYVALIGVEKGGLAMAGAVARHTGTPMVYYSLELYTWDHPWVKTSNLMRRLKRLEERYHRECALTIVQDEQRARTLLTSNQVPSSMRLAYLPVSLTGGPNHMPSRWLQSELCLSADQVVILSYGMILKMRLCIEMASVAQNFPENWRLVFHGQGSPAVINEIRSVDLLHKVCLSQRMVPASQCEMIVRSAKIGLAIYNDTPLNECLTGRSSEKIATYLKCGLPVIALRHPSYEHIEADKAGILVDRIEDIAAAVEEILLDCDSYVQNAYRCFGRYYSFEENFRNVLETLQDTSL
jgi:hypothetical protein